MTTKGATTTATAAKVPSLGSSIGTSQKNHSINNNNNKNNTIENKKQEDVAPVERLLEPPTLLARYGCAGLLVLLMVIWGKYSFLPESETPLIGQLDANGLPPPHHSIWVPIIGTTFYVLSLPMLRIFSSHYLSKQIDTKLLLKETMVVYNATQVLLNGWMVYRIIYALLFNNHPFIGNTTLLHTGTSYAVWIHYCDKYLEFFDTWFMVLRGRMDQVSFLHVYHHVSIAWAWWFGFKHIPGGDVYFGALLNSWIHVMMYSYYTLSLLKTSCPWKKYLTQAQLLQFFSVVVYTLTSSWIGYNQNVPIMVHAAYGLQIFEMTSLFVLFMHFYRKAYKSKKSEKKKSCDNKNSHKENEGNHNNNKEGNISSSASATESECGSDSIPEQVSVSSDSVDDCNNENKKDQ